MRDDTAVETIAVPAAPRPAGDEASPPSGGEDARITVSGLVKRFHRLGGEEVVAVDDISLSVGAGEFLVLLGPSGCGKTTLLRCLAGLEHPEDGRIDIDGRTVYDADARTELPPERRRISMMFQSYALWPHMTVYENVVYPLKSRGAVKEKGEGGGRRARQQALRERVASVLERVHCGNLLDQYPGSISGGQQQRVALARALVADDRVVLFDEPLSNVDAKVREELRFELLELQRKIGFSAVYVTHDQAEAMALADRIALLRDGRIEQIGSPKEVYHRPATRHVARFLGSVNELAGPASASSGATTVRTPIGPVTSTAAAPGGDGAAVIAAWRPEASLLCAERPDGPNVFRGTVKAALFLGSHREYAIDVDGVMLRVWRMEGAPVQEGSEAWISIDPVDVMVFPDGAERI